MAAGKLTPTDATKTYRYLRIGIICAVVLLGASILIERSKVAGCWQTSISAYYYTPARAIFVGSLIAVGLALIVIKGRTLREDRFLNAAGMFAPIVAVVPTTDVGKCWSIPPSPLPIGPDGKLASWVLTNIDNNFYALLVAGAVGLILALVIALVVNGIRKVVEPIERGTLLSLAGTAVALLAGWWLIEGWGDFTTKAHGYSAIAMFLCLIGAVASKALEHRDGSTKVYLRLYSAIGVLMPVGGGLLAITRVAGDHTVFALETFEIVLFAAFWIIQTWENWDEGASLRTA